MTSKKHTIKELRRIGHHLMPIVTIGANGNSSGVLKEIGRALDDHELIKIKIPAGDSNERRQLSESLAVATKSTLVQHIGRMVLLHKAAQMPNVKLSNISRFSA